MTELKKEAPSVCLKMQKDAAVCENETEVCNFPFGCEKNYCTEYYNYCMFDTIENFTGWE